MLRLMLFVMLFCALPMSAWSFGGTGCGSGKCSDCHSLTSEEVMKLLPPGADKIDSVKFAEVNGLWEVRGEARGQMFTVYVDFSKKYLIAGNILRLRDGVDISRHLDMKELSTDGAFLIGNKDAEVKVFVFTDVNCPHCQRMHQELYKVVKQNSNIAFYVKLIPFMTDKKTVNSIVCSGSNKVLDDAMEGKSVAENNCPSTYVEEIQAFTERWHISSTPTMVLPDGKIMPGERSASEILDVLKSYLLESK